MLRCGLQHLTRERGRATDSFNRETQELEDPFTNGLQYPGDTDGEAVEVYNCRCRLSSQIKGHERDITNLLNRSNKLNGMSYEEWKTSKFSELNSSTDVTRKARTRKEFQSLANEYNRELKTVFSNNSRWNNEIIVNGMMKFGTGRLKDGTNRIILSPYASDTVLVHELVHGYSTYNTSAQAITVAGYRWIEEATTAFFSENYMISIGQQADKVYPRLTRRLHILNKQLKLNRSDYEFSKELITVPIENRLDYLKEKASQAMIKKKGTTLRDMSLLDEYIDEIKGGLGYDKVVGRRVKA